MSNIVKSKTNISCDECEEPIKKGRYHFHHYIKNDYECNNYYVCFDCENLRKDFLDLINVYNPKIDKNSTIGSLFGAIESCGLVAAFDWKFGKYIIHDSPDESLSYETNLRLVGMRPEDFYSKY